MVFYRVKRVKGHYYLVKEWWDPVQKRKRSLSLGNCEKIEEMLWRRGRDLNPGVRLDNGLAIHPLGPDSGTPAGSMTMVVVSQYIFLRSCGSLRGLVEGSPGCSFSLFVAA